MAKKEDWYKRTEGKLYAYPSIEPAIAHLEAQVLLLNCNMVPPRAQTYDRIGPPSTGERLTEPEQFTNSRAEKIGKLKAKIALKKAEKVAIDAALKRLGAEEVDLVQKWYFVDWKLCHPEMKIWMALKICRAEFYVRKNEVITKVAKWLGELIEVESEERDECRENGCQGVVSR